MLEVLDIHKKFDNIEVLKGVDVRVEKGDVIAILGPSGSGKTTLLRCINFLEGAERGTMTFDGEAPAKRNTAVSSYRTSTAYPTTSLTK